MLSPQAWNAFLKTLEEPPPHTIFVLATTEANKVLPTVVDRCHRFDFGRPAVAQITDGAAPRRRRRADLDPRRGVRADRALGHRLVPRRARHAGAAARLLGPVDRSSRTCSRCSAPPTPTCCSARSTRSPPATRRSALLAAARLADSGRDIGRFFGDLEAHARSLMVVQTLGGEVPPELSVTAEQDERLREQAARVSPTDVVRMLDLIAVGLRAMKDGSDARTQLELALVKAAVPKVDASAKALQSRLERLEAGRPAPTPPRGRAGGRRADVPATAAGRAAPERRAEPAAAAGRASPRAAASAAAGASPPRRAPPRRPRPPAAPPRSPGRRRRRRRGPRRGAGGRRRRARPRRLRRAVAGRHPVDPGGAAAAGRAPEGRPPDGARQRRADAGVGRDRRRCPSARPRTPPTAS